MKNGPIKSRSDQGKRAEYNIFFVFFRILFSIEKSECYEYYAENFEWLDQFHPVIFFYICFKIQIPDGQGHQVVDDYTKNSEFHMKLIIFLSYETCLNAEEGKPAKGEKGVNQKFWLRIAFLSDIK